MQEGAEQFLARWLADSPTHSSHCERRCESDILINMDCAADYVYFARHQQDQQPRRQPNVNVVAINLGALSDQANQIIETGDPSLCQQCGAALTAISKIFFKQYRPQDIDLELTLESKIQFDGELAKIDSDQCLWCCEFCDHINILELEPEEIPAQNAKVLDYVLEIPEKADEKLDNDSSEAIVVFCIDVSGSMCVTQKAPRKFQLHRQNEQDDPFAFLPATDPDLHQYRHQSHQQNQETWVSRLQAVQSAVIAQLQALEKENPHAKVCLISFNNEVTIHGDGESTIEVIAAGKLFQQDRIQLIANNFDINKSISQCRGSLEDRLFSLQEKGQTALGPALVASIGIASQKRGSKVIICTDGLANIGIGSLAGLETEEDRRAATQWYTNIGTLAKNAGITVSVVSITDDQCQLDDVGRVADISGGVVERVNPFNLGANLSDIIFNDILATDVEATMILHKGLEFPPSQNDIADEGLALSKQVKIVGNAFKDTEIFFQYDLSQDRNIIQKYDYLTSLPFQVQIRYTRRDGARCVRFLSQRMQISKDLMEVERDVDVSILAANAAQEFAGLAQQGRFDELRDLEEENAAYFSLVAQNEQQKRNLGTYLDAMSEMNHALGIEDDVSEENKQDEDEDANADADEDEDEDDFAFGANDRALAARFMSDKERAIMVLAGPSIEKDMKKRHEERMNQNFDSFFFSGSQEVNRSRPQGRRRPRKSPQRERRSRRQAADRDDAAEKIYKLKKANRRRF